MPEPTTLYPVADRAGLTAALTDGWPAAYRLAVGLTGRADAAAAVAARVLDRAATVAGRWRTPDQAGRWFVRYTVLTARGLMAGTNDPPLAWLAPLTAQQREAVVLHHGLSLDLNRMAAAMDCSTRAAANHLVAAVKRLRGTGPTDDWMAGLPAVLSAVVPPPAGVAADVARVVDRHRRRRRIGAAAAVGVAGAAAVAAGWLWRHLTFL